MRILLINSVCGIGSTGRICVGIKKQYEKKYNGESNILYFWGKSSHDGIRCSNILLEKAQALTSRITGMYCFVSNTNTYRTIHEIEKYSPDIIHLHNIEDHTLNWAILFKYFKERLIKIVWTFHDCGPITGYCPHFLVSKCDKWITLCRECPEYKRYSWFFDKSSILYMTKRELFKDLNLTIVTPSNWLYGIVKKSFLADKKTVIIKNGIDLNTFKPTTGRFRIEHGLEDKKIVLGVSYDWSYRKGLDVFLKLASMLPEQYQIVLVGTNREYKNIITIHRTNSKEELSQLYSTSDVFLNPTCEDTYPTVNMEAIACGTPVITNSVGGSTEMLNEKCSIFVRDNSIEEFVSGIETVAMNRNEMSMACITQAQKCNQEECFENYIKLYGELYAH